MHCLQLRFAKRPADSSEAPADKKVAGCIEEEICIDTRLQEVDNEDGEKAKEENKASSVPDKEVEIVVARDKPPDAENTTTDKVQQQELPNAPEKVDVDDGKTDEQEKPKDQQPDEAKVVESEEGLFVLRAIELMLKQVEKKEFLSGLFGGQLLCFNRSGTKGTAGKKESHIHSQMTLK